MGYEVDFLPVQGGGAAITMRWGSPGDYKVLVYDGGSEAAGEQLVAHIRNHYLSEHVDYLVSSHPSSDHAGGLAMVLNELSVGEVWLHRPWVYAESMRQTQHAALRLEALALARRIPVREPYQGALIGPFAVLSPAKSWYLQALLPTFCAQIYWTQRWAKETTQYVSSWLHAAARWVHGDWWIEPLPESSTALAEHESSVVLYAEFEGRGVLLTGNAGIRALSAAVNFAERLGLNLPARLRLMQVPNQGRSNHLSTMVLDRIVGRRLPRRERTYTKSAFISLSRNVGNSAQRRVADALKRRGAMTFVTRDAHLRHSHDMPDRGWPRAMPLDPKH